MTIFFICSNLYNCLRSLCIVAIRMENEKENRKSLLQAASLLFRCFSCIHLFPRNFKFKPKYQRLLFPDYLSVSYDYAVKLQTCVTSEVVYYLPSIKDDVGTIRIFFLLNFNYETKYKSSHVVY